MSETPRKEDRRKQRTRRLLRQAMMELIIEKGYENITIQDITDRADVSRATFYLHYSKGGKEELLNSSIREMYDELLGNYEPFSWDDVQRTGYADSLMSPVDYQHVADYAEFYRAMLGDRGAPFFVSTVHNYLAQVCQNVFSDSHFPDSHSPRLPPDMIAHALAGMHIGIVMWWLQSGLRYSPEEMAKMHYYMAAFGMWKAMGVEVPTPDFEASPPDGAADSQ